MRGTGLEACYKGTAAFLDQMQLRISEIDLTGRIPLEKGLLDSSQYGFVFHKSLLTTEAIFSGYLTGLGL